MVQSLSSKVDIVIKGVYYGVFTSYGNIMIGNGGFEFYNEKNVQKNLQISWDKIDYVTALVLFKGKWIPRFCIYTKDKSTYYFSCKKPKTILKEIGKYIPHDKMYRSLGFLQKIKDKFKK